MAIVFDAADRSVPSLHAASFAAPMKVLRLGAEQHNPRVLVREHAALVSGPRAAQGALPLGRNNRATSRRFERGQLRAFGFSEVVALLDAFAAQLPQQAAALGPRGPIYFVLLGTLVESLLLPVTPLVFMSGLLFGAPLGTALTLLFMSGSATIGFVLCRSVFRPRVERLLGSNKRFQMINKAVEREGFKIMFLLRLSPLLPSPVANYAFALSNTRYRDFILATILGYVPYSAGLVYSATVTGSALGQGSRQQWQFYAAALFLTLGLLKLIARVAGNAVADAMEDDDKVVSG